MPMAESMELPPEPTATAPAEPGADIAVSGSRVPSSRADRSSPIVTPDDRVSEARIPPGHYPRPPQPQSGLLTAGDHDDLLNPELYASYAGRFLQRSNLGGLPRLDTRRMLTVAVQDQAGRPVPFAQVTIHCGDGNSLSLATLADGTATFFPGLDRLGDRVRLSVAGGPVRMIDLAGAGAQRQSVTTGGGAAPIRKFDLMLAIDTTGSMGDEIGYLI
jgi:hypothetical protein